MNEKFSFKEINEAGISKRSAARCTPAACGLYDLPTGSCTFPAEPKHVKLSADCKYNLTKRHSTDIVELRRDTVKKQFITYEDEATPRRLGYVLPE